MLFDNAPKILLQRCQVVPRLQRLFPVVHVQLYQSRLDNDVCKINETALHTYEGMVDSQLFPTLTNRWEVFLYRYLNARAS